jgi:hypothetical protein
MTQWILEGIGSWRGRAFVSALALVATVSYLAGRYAVPAAAVAMAPQVRPEQGIPAVQPAAHAELAPCGDGGPLPRRIVELEARYRALALASAAGLGAAVLSAKRGDALPGPLPFPEGLPSAQTPQHFKEAATSILQKCMPTLAVQDADCSEYPCIAWASFDASTRNRFDVTGCDDWSKTMGKKTMVYVQLSPDGSTGFYGVFSLPEDKAAVTRANARADLRIKALAESYGIVVP